MCNVFSAMTSDCEPLIPKTIPRSGLKKKDTPTILGLFNLISERFILFGVAIGSSESTQAGLIYMILCYNVYM